MENLCKDCEKRTRMLGPSFNEQEIEGLFPGSKGCSRRGVILCSAYTVNGMLRQCRLGQCMVGRKGECFTKMEDVKKRVGQQKNKWRNR